MSSLDLVDPARRPQRILIYALIPPAAVLIYAGVEIALEILLGRPTPVDLGYHLIASLIVAGGVLVASVFVVARSSRPFLALNDATRALVRDPSLGAGAIPLTGRPETVELACTIREMTLALGAARTAHEGLLRAIDGGPVGLLQVEGGSGLVRYVNTAFCRLLSWPSPAVCFGHRIQDLDPDAIAAVTAEGRARLDAGETWSVEREFRAFDGVRRLALTTVPIPSQLLDGPSFLVFVEDRTAQAAHDEMRATYAGVHAALPELAATVTASRGLLELVLRDPLLPGSLRSEIGALLDGTAATARQLDPLIGRASA